jgi:hypothetical protein
MATVIEIEKVASTYQSRSAPPLRQAYSIHFRVFCLMKMKVLPEALRNAEIDADPSQAISLAQLDSQIQNRPRCCAGNSMTARRDRFFIFR